MTILVVYSEEPNFPATDQRPDAARYHIGDVWVDAIGGAPMQADVDAILRPSPSSAESNGAALTERQRQAAKDEAAALASDGNFEAAIKILLELN